MSDWPPEITIKLPLSENPPSSREEIEQAPTERPIDYRAELDGLTLAIERISSGEDLLAVEARAKAIRARMGPAEHVLKTDPGPFALVKFGLKRYEIRKFDRPYKVGDHLRLVEFNREFGKYTGDFLVVRVSTMTKPGEYGLPPDLCVMGIDSVIEGGE